MKTGGGRGSLPPRTLRGAYHRHRESLCRRREFRKIVSYQPTLCRSEINNNHSNSTSKSIMVIQCFVVFKAHPHFCDLMAPEATLERPALKGDPPWPLKSEDSEL